MSSNFSEGEVMAVAVVTIPLVFCALSARIYAKIFVIKSFATDDWLMVFAAIVFCSAEAALLFSARSGFGKHEEFLNPDSILYVKRTFMMIELSYISSSTIAKLSITFFLLKLTVLPIHRHVVIHTTICYVTMATAGILCTLFQCLPVAGFWDPSNGAHCYDRHILVILATINGVTNALVDAIFAILPIHMIWKLQMDKRTKFSVSCLLGIGLITSVVDLVRLKYVWALGVEKDGTYEWVPITIASTIEVAVRICGGCLANFRPLIRRLRFWVLGPEPLEADAPQKMVPRNEITRVSTDVATLASNATYNHPHLAPGIWEDTSNRLSTNQNSQLSTAITAVGTHLTLPESRFDEPPTPIAGGSEIDLDIDGRDWAAKCAAMNTHPPSLNVHTLPMPQKPPLTRKYAYHCSEELVLPSFESGKQPDLEFGQRL